MWKQRCHYKFFCVYSTWTNDSEVEIIKRFTHSEIVNYLMEFPFHYLHIWRTWHQIGKFTVCENRGVTTTFLCVESTWTNDIGNEIINRFTISEIVNYLMEFKFHYSQLYLKTWHQIWKITVCENRGVTTNFSVYNLHGPMT